MTITIIFKSMVARIWNDDWHKYFHPSNIKIDLSYHPFIKDDIFEVTVNLPPRGNPIVIVAQYCENNNMSYIYRSTKNSPLNRDFTTRNRNNVWILIIGIKESPKVKQVLEAIPSRQLTVKYDRAHIITSRIYNNYVRNNIQEKYLY